MLRSLIILLLKDGGDIVGIQVKVISNILNPHMFIYGKETVKVIGSRKRE